MASACAQCRMAILPNEVFVQMDGREFHHKCVRCSRCQNPIVHRYMLSKAGEVLCSQCGVSTCARCIQPIHSTAEVQAQGKSFHLECFSCVKCRIQLTGKYYGDASAPKCASCELPQCSFCITTIPGGTRFDILPETNQVMCSSCRQSNVVQGKIVAGPGYPPVASVPPSAPSMPVTIVLDQPITYSTVQPVTVPGQQPTYVTHTHHQTVTVPLQTVPLSVPLHGPVPSSRPTQVIITDPIPHPASRPPLYGHAMHGNHPGHGGHPVQLSPMHVNQDTGKTNVHPAGAMPRFYGTGA